MLKTAFAAAAGLAATDKGGFPGASPSAPRRRSASLGGAGQVLRAFEQEAPERLNKDDRSRQLGSDDSDDEWNTKGPSGYGQAREPEYYAVPDYNDEANYEAYCRSYPEYCQAASGDNYLRKPPSPKSPPAYASMGEMSPKGKSKAKGKKPATKGKKPATKVKNTAAKAMRNLDIDEED